MHERSRGLRHLGSAGGVVSRHEASRAEGDLKVQAPGQAYRGNPLKGLSELQGWGDDKGTTSQEHLCGCVVATSRHWSCARSLRKQGHLQGRFEPTHVDIESVGGLEADPKRGLVGLSDCLS